MTEGPEVAVLIHELGGMLSSVQGFAHIAESNPGHKDRERYIKLAASEARRAALALKDLHLARSLDRGGIPAAPPPVDLAELLASVEGVDAAAAHGCMVRADPSKLRGLLGRCLLAGVSGARVSADGGGGAEIAVVLGPEADLQRRKQALAAPYPDMIPFSLMRRLLELWGGGLTLAAIDRDTVITLRFAGA